MKLTGLVPAVFTPMHEDGSLNLTMVPVMVEHLLAQGASGLYVNGSTGEGVSLTSSERIAVAEAYVQAAGGRVPVIIQVGHNSLAEARALAAHAQAIGADAISATPPSYFKPSTLDALVDCMAQVSAGAHRLPFYYYHIPSVTGVDLDMVDFLALAGMRLPTLAGIKYSKTSVYEMQSCLNFDGGRYSLLFGSDQMLLSALVAGVQGAVGSTYNYMMPIYHRIWRSFKAGDVVEAQRLQGIAAELVRPTYRWGNPALKAMMNLIGLDCGPPRLPQVSLTAGETDELRQKMDSLGFFEWTQRSDSFATAERA